MPPENVINSLRRGGVDALRYLWCDNGNVLRAKSLFLPAFLAYYAQKSDADLLAGLEEAVTMTAAMMSVPATRDVPAPEAGLAPVEDVRLAPAWESISLPGAAERTATVICDLLKGEVPWEHCPRSYLKRMIARLHAQGLDLHIGFEIEFYLLRPQEEAPFPLPVDDLAYAQSLAGQISHEVMAEIALDLWRRGIPVAQYLAEGGPGQQEITLEHCGPLLLADRLIQAREIIHAVALKHGLQATFLPKPFPEQAGSGLHTHFSLWQEGANHTCAAGEAWDLTPQTNAFMAGILNHLPALMAVTTPTRSSFRRIQPHAWSGAYQAWGIGNKEAALRVISDARSGRPSNVELKTVDGSANPYLALGGLIAAGLEGIKKGDAPAAAGGDRSRRLQRRRAGGPGYRPVARRGRGGAGPFHGRQCAAGGDGRLHGRRLRRRAPRRAAEPGRLFV